MAQLQVTNMKPKISDLIWLALALAIWPAISLADSLANQILWNKDGAEMAYLFRPGPFHLDNVSDALPVHTVTLDGFYMDMSEVTVGQFKAFVADSGYSWAVIGIMWLYTHRWIIIR